MTTALIFIMDNIFTQSQGELTVNFLSRFFLSVPLFTLWPNPTILAEVTFNPGGQGRVLTVILKTIYFIRATIFFTLQPYPTIVNRGHYLPYEIDSLIRLVLRSLFTF